MSDELDSEDTPPAGVTDASQHLGLPLVPPDVSRRLRQTFRANLPVFTAELVTDTRFDEALAGARGGAATAWSMSYRAGPCDIVLDLEPGRSSIRFNGQLLCPEPTSDGVLRVFRDDELVTSGSTDEFGQFELGEVPPASYLVTVSQADHLIEMVVELSGQV